MRQNKMAVFITGIVLIRLKQITILNFMKENVKKEGLCGALMPSEGTKMLEFN